MMNFSDYKLLLETFTLKYMSFDWDDNILFMPTVIHMQRSEGGQWIDEDVSTEKFAQIRSNKDWRIKDNKPEVAFAEFRDYGPRGENAFIEDTKKAIAKKDFGPSWDQFIKALVRGNIFSIITARGHEPQTLRKGTRYVIDTQLSDEQKHEMAANLTAYHNMFSNTDPMKEFSFDQLVEEYLDSCDFIGITSKAFAKMAGDDFDSSNPEEGKQIAMEHFIKKIHDFGKQVGGKVQMGFSDDDKGNVEHIHKLFRDELSLKYVMDYTVFDTSDPKLKGGVKMEESVRTFNEYKGGEKIEWYKPENL
ncbi:MAG: hypothetical protein SLAVMIC_00480 [uncultured marine phage]|uniref:Uncharacterized protein n=1 Tax=uncultured marine phage TaxID=707152 RepID=A0A8D9FRK6_9VIRU|nr:MAG: hypothetical protein SLAVMIC_00480 [uncultured marine phage]